MGDFDLKLPLDDIDGLPDGLLARLTMSPTFKGGCGQGKQPMAEATVLRPKLLQVAGNFTHDAFMGLAPLLVPPRVIAAGALAVAVRYVRREMTLPELCRLLEAADSSLAQPQVFQAIEEIFNVYRTKSGVGPGVQRTPSSDKPPETPGSTGKAPQPPPPKLGEAPVEPESRRHLNAPGIHSEARTDRAGLTPMRETSRLTELSNRERGHVW